MGISTWKWIRVATLCIVTLVVMYKLQHTAEKGTASLKPVETDITTNTEATEQSGACLRGCKDQMLTSNAEEANPQEFPSPPLTSTLSALS